MWLDVSERNQGTNLLKTKILCSRHGERRWLKYQRSIRHWSTLEEQRKSKEHAEREEGWGRLVSTQACPKGWHYACEFSGFRAGLAISESWLVSMLFRYRYTGIKLSKTVKTRKTVHEFENDIREVDTRILWLLYFFSREGIWEMQLLQEVHVVHLQWEAKLPGDQDTSTSGQLFLFLEWQSPGIEWQSEVSSGNPSGQLGFHLFQLDDHYMYSHSTLCPTL